MYRLSGLRSLDAYRDGSRDPICNRAETRNKGSLCFGDVPRIQPHEPEVQFSPKAVLSLNEFRFRMTAMLKKSSMEIVALANINDGVEQVEDPVRFRGDTKLAAWRTDT